MTELEKHKDLISMLALEISDRFKAITSIFPKDNEKVMKHLAAAAIHMTLFMRDLYMTLEEEDIMACVDKAEASFLKNCGCEK